MVRRIHRRVCRGERVAGPTSRHKPPTTERGRSWHGAAAGAEQISGDADVLDRAGVAYAGMTDFRISPCQIRFRRVRIARTMEKSAVSHG
jgi:hypothetical protein